MSKSIGGAFYPGLKIGIWRRRMYQKYFSGVMGKKASFSTRQIIDEVPKNEPFCFLLIKNSLNKIAMISRDCRGIHAWHIDCIIIVAR
jgi:hypothetical protein